jgi:ketosteroid isomerase-like protein
MPDAPDVTFFTRFVLEQPLPVAVVLVAIAGVLGFVARRDGNRRLLYAAGAALLLAVIVYVISQLVETSGEKAETLTKQFVRLAVAGDAVGTMALFSDDAVLTLVTPTSEAQSIALVRSGVEAVARRYMIDDNRITQLRGYTVDGDHAIVHMTCMTEVAGTTAQTQWVLSVREQADGSWKVEKLTWVNVNRQRPSLSMLR